MKLPAPILACLLPCALHAQTTDSVTVGPTQSKPVVAVESWFWNGTAWVRGVGGGVQRNATVTLAASSGVIAAGAIYVEFIFSSDFQGTVMGVAYTGADGSDPWPVLPGNDTYGSMNYTVAAGSIRIKVTR